jgi:aryl-alcohol dehydrogenase-like predicted oxidoreductase
MGMSQAYGARDDAESIATVHHAIDLGVTLFDTANVYGAGHNEELLGKALRGCRDGLIVATKFGQVRGPNNERRGANGRPDYVRECCEASLKRLGMDVIDLYFQHRVDPETPIEDTVGALADLAREGKIRYYGLSEAAPATIRRAHAVHPMTALQTEYSLWSREPEDEILATVRELGIGFVAYSPLGRGFLTGEIKRVEDLAETDSRRNMPRFQPENFAHNIRLVEAVEALAAAKGCAPAQIALAWVLGRGDDIVPIPGTKRRTYLEQNIAALEIGFSADELAQLDAAFPPLAAQGHRYGPVMQAMLNQ